MAHPCFKIACLDELHLIFISTDTRCDAFCEQSPLADGLEYGTLSRINETKYSNYRLDSFYFSPSHAKCLSQSFKLQITRLLEKGCRVSKQPWLLLRKRNGRFLFPLEGFCLGKQDDWSSLSFPMGTRCVG